MGKFLRLANTDEVKRYYYEDTEEYIDLRGELSKQQASNLLRFAPRKEDDLDGGMRFIAKAFNDLIVGWSLTDEKGKDVAPSMEVYEQLEAAAATWIDRTVGEHLREALVGEGDQAEGKLEG